MLTLVTIKISQRENKIIVDFEPGPTGFEFLSFGAAGEFVHGMLNNPLNITDYWTP